MSKFILVGGTGFIGSYLASLLSDKGNEVLILSRKSSNYKDINAKVHYVDYDDFNAMKKIISCGDIVIHLAHENIFVESINNDNDNVNIEMTNNLLNACYDKKASKFIYISSGGAIYGEPSERKPIKESSDKKPISQYGFSKLTIENKIHEFVLKKSLPTLIIRPSNAYGIGQYPFKGQGIIATFLASAIKHKPFHIYGDGENIRDYISIHDLCNAIFDLIYSGVEGEVYNISSGIGISTNNLIQNHLLPLLQCNNYPCNINYIENKNADVKYNVLDNNKIKNAIDFNPLSLDDVLPGYWDWLIKKIG